MGHDSILAGDRGQGKAFKKYMKLGILAAVVGFVVCCGALLLGAVLSQQMWGREKRTMTLFAGVVAAAGGILAASGIAAPFLGMYDAKKCYIDVYSDSVSGCRVVHQAGQIDRYEMFQLTYDQITGVDVKKNKVFLHVGVGTFECHAFNAEEICTEIRRRI